MYAVSGVSFDYSSAGLMLLCDAHKLLFIHNSVSDVLTHIYICRYPLQELPDVVVSELELWEVDSLAGGFFSLSYWHSIFNNRPDYNIILKQQDLDT